MLFSIVIIIIGLIIIYLVFDFLALCGANINKFGDKWLAKTLWIWLPIYGIWRLTREVILKKK